MIKADPNAMVECGHPTLELDGYGWRCRLCGAKLDLGLQPPPCHQGGAELPSPVPLQVHRLRCLAMVVAGVPLDLPEDDDADRGGMVIVCQGPPFCDLAGEEMRTAARRGCTKCQHIDPDEAQYITAAGRDWTESAWFDQVARDAPDLDPDEFDDFWAEQQDKRRRGRPN
jgi:hypothetical protein